MKVSRGVLILTLLLVAAAAALLLVRQQSTEPDYTTGGPLFPVEPEEIDGFLLTQRGVQYRLDRVGDRWSLSGAVADYVDTLAIQKLFETLLFTRGGPLLAGTEPEDRRYEFNGPEAIRLTLFVRDGEPISLALGTANPVSGHFYGSGAGREACFLVPASLRKTLSDLPGFIQLRTLLPQVDRDVLERVVVSRGGREFLVEKKGDRWWLQMPPEGPSFLGQEVRDYQAMYDDRRRSDDRGTWILGSTPAVNLLVHNVSATIVREIKPPAEGASLTGIWDLDPPWHQVTLTGAGINPDPGAGDPDGLVIGFGPSVRPDVVPAVRRDQVLLTDGVALEVLEQSVGILAHRTALTFRALEADVVTLEREGRLLLRGTRTGEAVTREGRNAWLTAIPRTVREGLDEILRHGLTRDVVVNLDRIAVLAVLPPVQDAGVLADRERVRIVLSFGTGEDVTSQVLEFGYLVEDRLPAGAGQLARTEGGRPPVGLWFPADGRLLQVPDQFVVTARNMVQFVPPVLPE